MVAVAGLSPIWLGLVDESLLVCVHIIYVKFVMVLSVISMFVVADASSSRICIFY